MSTFDTKSLHCTNNSLVRTKLEAIIAETKDAADRILPLAKEIFPDSDLPEAPRAASVAHVQKQRENYISGDTPESFIPFPKDAPCRHC